jgi:glycosyltransferase involved in cell wall biosynthesis
MTRISAKKPFSHNVLLNLQAGLYMGTGFFIAMKKIAIFITTYNRPHTLIDLLVDIWRESRGYEVNLLIINDHSTDNYTAVRSFLEDDFKGRYRYIENRQNNGKKYYWKTVANGYEYMSSQKFDYFIQLPDDVRLVKGFFRQAVKAWERITDPHKACLNILVDYGRLMKPFWTSYQPRSVVFGKLDLIRTGWVDLCFISSHAYLEAINYTISPVDPRWGGKQGLSSGVGMQVSRLLISGARSIYSLKRSLVIHDDHSSVMHPEHRQDTKLITNHNMDKIIATMATMPGREESLKDVIKSIIDQVDELRIYANNMHQAPIKLHHRKLKWLFGDDHAGDLGDAGKFYQVEDINGYHFTIDDDIIYPQNYVATLIAAIEHYERRCVISVHGRTFPSGLIRSYYHGAISRYPCLRRVPRDTFAHVIGTGVLAYHTDTIRIPFEEFKASNMADIWFSKYCQAKGIPRLVLKHDGGWIKDSPNYDQATTIYADNCRDDSLQTQVVNSIKWTLP